MPIDVVYATPELIPCFYDTLTPEELAAVAGSAELR